MPEHIWDDIYKRLALLVEGEKVSTLREGAQLLGINRKTLTDNLISVFDVRAESLASFPEILEKHYRDTASVVEKIYEDKEQNTWSIDATDRRVKTLNDLIRVCKIDLDTWRVDRWVANKWEVGGYDRAEGDSGNWHRDYGKLKVHPLYQVKAWLSRINPIAIMPVLQPIQISSTVLKPKRQSNVGMKRALVIYDMQVGFRRNLQTNELIPFHDRRVLDIGLQIAQHKQVDNVIYGGDELDLSEWSTHWTAEPEFYFTTQAAIIELHWWLSQFRQAAPNAEMTMLDGNHNRFTDAIVSNLKAAYQLRPADELHRDAVLTTPRMLALDALHIENVDSYKNGSSRKWLTDELSFVHSDVARAGAGATAGEMANKNYSTTIYGHSHRRELASKTMLFRDKRTTITTFCPGGACHVDGRVPGSKEDNQWQQGIAVIEYTKDRHNIIPVEIEDGVALYDGIVFTATDRDADANKAIQTGMHQITKGGDAL